MHPPLIAILQSGLDAPAQRLFTLIYAYTNGTGRCDIPESEVLDLLDISAGTLRRYRAQLAAAGYVSSRVRNGILSAFIVDRDLNDDPDRAQDARSDPETAHPMRASQSAIPETAHPMRAFDPDEDPDRAPDARFVSPSGESDPETAHPMRASQSAIPKGHAVRNPQSAIRNQSAHPVRETRTPCALLNPQSAIRNPQSPKPRTPCALLGGRGVVGGSLISSTPEDQEPPPPTPPVNPQSEIRNPQSNNPQSWNPRQHPLTGDLANDLHRTPDLAEAARTRRLLVDLGVSAPKAIELARRCGFWRTFSHAIAWRAEGNRGIGALVYRLEQQWLPPPIPPAVAGPANALYLTHVLDGDPANVAEIERAVLYKRYLPDGYEHLLEH
jgi:hypothetical protein